MGFDLSWDTLAILKRGMRIHYAELLPRIIVFERNKQAGVPLVNTGCSVMYLW